MEHVQDVQNLIPAVWRDLLRCSRLDSLLLAACPCFGTWLVLAMQPPRLPIDPGCLISATQVGNRQILQGFVLILSLFYVQGAHRKMKYSKKEEKSVPGGESSANKTDLDLDPEPTDLSPQVTDKVFMGGAADGDPTVVAAARLRLTKMLGGLASYIVTPLQNG